VLERRLLKNLDYRLLGLVLFLMLASLVILASASQSAGLEKGDLWFFVKRQAVWIGAGLVAMLLVLTIDYHDLAQLSTVIYVFNLALLAGVLVAGREALGASRWLRIGPLDIQPSEFAKLAMIITLANHLARREGKLGEWRDLVPPFLHIGLPMLLILRQPDLGTSLVFLAILFGMLFMAGAPIRRLLGLAAGGLTLAVAWILLHLTFPKVIPIPLKDYQLKRLIVFVNPNLAPLREGYHIIQSKIAVGSGYILGKGLFHGTQNQLNYLPEQHTDFIFSVIGEELGFVGATLLLLIYFNILWRGVHAASQARDLYGTLLATGVVSMLTFHVLVNVGMTIGIMPVTGIPLPFMSYGGSSLLTNAIAVGLLLNVYMRRQKILF